jgi:glycosidase
MKEITVVAALLAVALSLCVFSEPYSSQKWWQKTIIYQIYPRSFQDTNGDGIGDLKGITSRLDYFRYMHVGALWINPIFSSPMKDFGYDISNYTNIDPIFGTLEDFDELVSEAHKRELKIILDFVPNHTSDKHPWFVESRKSKGNPKRDWYVWADGVSGGPPNNWQSRFGGSAWKYDNETGQYYFHQYLPEQPDLNYRNSDVIKSMKDILTFWLEKGVDGFRFDAVKFLLEDPLLRNEPCLDKHNTDCHNPSYRDLNHSFTGNLPEIHDILKEWRKHIESYSEKQKLVVIEVYDAVPTVMSYYGDMDECDFPFNFLLVKLPQQNWTGTGINTTISQWLEASPDGAWPNWVVGNHDNPRTASKLGIGMSALVNMLLLTLPGTPTSYYGDEIGMTDVLVPINQTQDPKGINDWTRSRDPERSPMQWDSSLNAGFTSGNRPWLPLASNWTSVNVEREKHDNGSILNVYRHLAAFRASVTALQGIVYAPVYADKNLYLFRRGDYSDAHQYIIAVNLGDETVSQVWGHVPFASTGVIIVSTGMDRNGNHISVTNSDLRKGEGIVVQINMEAGH